VSESRDLLSRTAEIAADYLESLGERPVFPRTTPEALREALGGPMPEEPLDPDEVVAELAEAAEPGVVATGSGRYFGFVIGGAVPAWRPTGSPLPGTRTPASTPAARPRR
jgi:hypothetical protein